MAWLLLVWLLINLLFRAVASVIATIVAELIEAFVRCTCQGARGTTLFSVGLDMDTLLESPVVLLMQSYCMRSF